MPADDRRLYPWAVQGTLTPATIVSGSGSYFTDAAGNRHLDLAAQLAYMNVGHGHAHVVEAIRKQAAELPVIGPNFANRPAARLAEMLSEVTPRSEERRVGKEGSSRGEAAHEEKQR